MEEISEINNKIQALDYKPASLFTNSLLHTTDTTQLIRDIRDDELALFQNRKISDIDHEVLNNIKDYDEKLIDDLIHSNKVPPVNIEGQSSDIQSDLETLAIIQNRVNKLSQMGHLNEKIGGNYNQKVETINTLLQEVKKVIEEVNDLQKIADQKSTNSS